MPVELRARRSRPSYVTILELPDDDEGKPTYPEEDASSESAFEPPEAGDEKEDDVDDGDVDVASDKEEELIRDDESAIASTTATTSKSKGKRKATAPGHPGIATLHRPSTVMLATGLSRPNTRQLYSLPLPSINHRHRGTPIHNPPSRVFRLVNEPKLFAHAETVVSRGISDPRVRERITKAHMYNIGQGPVWELLEDRSWFKECDSGDQTRPIVYRSLRLKDGWQVLTPEASSPYLPSKQEGSEPCSPLICFFGPHENQQKVELNIFESVKIADFFPESKSHVFHAGAPVWSMDWCPVSMDDLPRRSYKQYIAIAPFPTSAHSPEIGRRVARPSPACIQIWSLSPSLPVADNPLSKGKTKINETEDVGVMTCEMVLCLDGGPAHDMKWCPLPAHDEYGETISASTTRKLGVLAGTFEDGSLSLYVVPDPQTLPHPSATTSGPIFVKLEPHLRIELEDTSCWSLDWANSDLIAVGCTNGSVAVFHVKDALNAADGFTPGALRPSHYIQLHQSAVRAVSWARAPPTAGSGAVRLDRDPTVILSGGYDGAQIVTDIRDRRGNVMNRTRDVINSIAHSHHMGGPLVTDNENTVKNFAMTPSMLGRGHALLEPSGPVWTISASDFHPQIAVGSADGTCQTTNMMKSTRRGGAVPFFIHKVFQMDYSRTSGAFRMMENFLPHEHQDRPTATRAKKKNGSEEKLEPTSTGAWSPEVAVTRVVWQSGSGLARAPLLASATASGLCRIDWLLGRFANDRFPYKNIEYLRGEVEGVEIDEIEDD